jgi:hypothetical protein
MEQVQNFTTACERAYLFYKKSSHWDFKPTFPVRSDGPSGPRTCPADWRCESAPARGISALAHGSGSARQKRYLMTWKFFVSASEVLKSALVCSTWSTWCPLVRIAEANLHQRRAGDKAYSAYFNPSLIPRYLSNLPLNILILWDVTMFSVRLFQLEHTLFPLFTWRPILLLIYTSKRLM